MRPSIQLGTVLVAVLTMLLVMTGTAGAASTDPTSVNFGNVPLHTTATQNIAITLDTGSKIFSVGGPIDSPFFFDFDTCVPSVIGPATCNVKESFTPTTTGLVSGTLSFTECSAFDNSCIDVKVPVQGTGVSVASANPTSVNFGNVPLHTTATQNIAITLDTGSRLLQVGGSIDAPFAFDFDTCVGTVMGPATCNVKESFTPTTTGLVSGKLTFTEWSGFDNSTMDIVVPVQGTGIQSVDTVPPATTASATSAGNPYSFGAWTNADVTVSLSATDNQDGSGIDKTEYSLDGATTWTPYAAPFSVSKEGASTLQYRSRDKTGNLESAKTATIRIDKTAATVAITDPGAGYGVQDGLTLMASVTDTASGPDSLYFYLRGDNNTADGNQVGFEKLAATKGTVSSGAAPFSFSFDTTKLPDGNYLLLAEGYDKAGNLTWTKLPFKIVNSGAVNLLSSTDKSKAGRTMRVKFGLRDSLTNNFVENQQLLIKIYEKSKPVSILQSSTYGTKNTSYRIDNTVELYTTSFQPGKTPTTYVVEVWRKTATGPFASFEFQTVK